MEISKREIVINKIKQEFDNKLGKLEQMEKDLSSLIHTTNIIISNTVATSKLIEKGLLDNEKITNITSMHKDKSDNKSVISSKMTDRSKSTVRDNKADTKSINNTRNKTPSKAVLTTNTTKSKLETNIKSTRDKTPNKLANSTLSQSKLSTIKPNKIVNIKSSESVAHTLNKSKEPPSRNQTKIGNQLTKTNSNLNTPKAKGGIIQKVIKGSKKEADDTTNNKSNIITKVETKIINDNNNSINIDHKENLELNKDNDTRVSINVSNILGAIDNSVMDNELIKDQTINSTFVKIDEINLTNNKIDLKLPKTVNKKEIFIKNFNHIVKFYSFKEAIKSLCVSKLFLKLTLNSFIEHFDQEAKPYNSKIKEVKEKYNEKDFSKEIEPFKFTKGAEKAIDLLNEGMYAKFFKEEKVPISDFLLPYKLYLQIINQKVFNNIFNKSDSEIWNHIRQVLSPSEDGQGAGSILFNSMNKYIDFSPENIYNIIKLLGADGHKISPNYYSKTCGTTGLIVFYIKDVFDYLGINLERRTNAKRALKTYTDCIDYLNNIKEKLVNKVSKL